MLRHTLPLLLLLPMLHAGDSGNWRHLELRRFPAAEANQGVAVDAEHFYAITNHAIGKYRKSDGARVGGWEGPKDGPIQHLNSGIVIGDHLHVAHSNFPKLPEESSVEIWDTATMQPVDRHVFPNPPGSLTWIVPDGDGWLACFAHYRKTSDPAKSRVVRFDADWKRVASWAFPKALIERFAGSSSSGGAIGPGGQLFLSGHDAKELYLVRLPAEDGGEVIWEHTLPISAEGQAFAWDATKPGKLYSISRAKREVIVSRVTQGAELPQRGFCAHRGAMATHPENTVPAFEEAARLGAAMIEFDVQLTRDGALVLMHDDSVDRTTDGKGKVADLTLDEIRRLDAGVRKDPRFAGTRVPTLEEALAAMPRNVWLNCHLKGGADLGRAVAQALERLDRLDQTFLAAQKDAARGAREAVPGILICNMERQSAALDYVNETIAMKADFIQLRGKGEIDPAHTALLREAGIRINYYECPTPEIARRLFEGGIEFPLVNDLAAFVPLGRELGLFWNAAP